ncbi:hypothetical protein EIP91_005065 [Steccherinum ochraceum]|uniref:Anti-proliferative protein domain-containing protein n=1 Tax=Steccherinum ochraceum TaxID=92696 RepID=A0A4R0RS26_9APHY|nr:hypothetical protein EIP91_005065 [Steccherinum ochraceum]
MASTTSPAAGSLAVTLAHAITYLTRSLITRYSATTIIKLQLALEANLTSQFSASWVPSEPLRGSGRRCLTLAPHSAPPRAIHNACKAAGVEWSQWISVLGGVEFDLFIDPGSVSARFGNWDTGKVTKCLTIWSESAVETARASKQVGAERQLSMDLRAQAKARALATQIQNAGKTVAQQLMIDDHEEDELFAMIADEVREPTWMTPVLNQFPTIPAPPRSTNSSPVSVASSTSTNSMHSRSSSRSSNSSSGFSVGSSDSCGSNTTIGSEKTTNKLSRRERARQARVYIDPSKTDVTNYDGGKTTVLTGGVMLGAMNNAKPKAVATVAVPTHKKTASSSSSNWRLTRA